MDDRLYTEDEVLESLGRIDDAYDKSIRRMQTLIKVVALVESKYDSGSNVKVNLGTDEEFITARVVVDGQLAVDFSQPAARPEDFVEALKDHLSDREISDER